MNPSVAARLGWARWFLIVFGLAACGKSHLSDDSGGPVDAGSRDDVASDVVSVEPIPSDDERCLPGLGGLVHASVWSQGGTIYAYLEHESDDRAGGARHLLRFEEGDVSRALEESGAPLGRVVTGFVEGELLLAQGSDCPLASVNGGAPHCLPGAPDERLIGVHAVDGTMLWTLWEDREIGYLYRAGSGEERWARRWQMEGEGAFEALITGTRGVLVLAERHQLRVAGPGFSLRPLLAPPGPYLAVWSGPEVPVWVGTADGRLLGFDGLGWTERSTPAAEIQHLSGAEERLYFASDTLLGRLDASGTPETLVEWSEATPWRIRSIHASQISDEVDLVVEDRRSASLACGGYRVMAHDGERLRAL